MISTEFGVQLEGEYGVDGYSDEYTRRCHNINEVNVVAKARNESL
ncbi:hypothetical protein [Gilliamella sp. wkB171]|nr:hypothetical protein [Gilliamella apicola]